tara:strand:- start:256 stop:804 length:549 start_codon:yes stop_codon:yes gene_type:complete
MNIKYTRTRGGTLPTRANQADAGLDLPFNPEDSKPVHIQPGQSVLLQTGLRFAIPEGYMLEIKNRSGNASKRSLVVGACVVDPGYDGEVFVNLHNIGTNLQQVEPGSKIAQAVLIPVVHFGLEEIEESFLSAINRQTSQRGEGALGSTDKNSEVTLDLTTKDIDPFETVLTFADPPNCPTKW